MLFLQVGDVAYILVIDSITGAKMYACQEMKQPEDLLEDLMRFSDRSPRQLLFAGTRREDASAPTDQTVKHEEATLSKETSHVSTTKPSYPPLPEEPTDKKLIYSIGICLPSGQRVQRRTHALLSFCRASMEQSFSCNCEAGMKSKFLFDTHSEVADALHGFLEPVDSPLLPLDTLFQNDMDSLICSSSYPPPSLNGQDGGVSLNLNLDR